MEENAEAAAVAATSAGRCTAIGVDSVSNRRDRNSDACRLHRSMLLGLKFTAEAHAI